MRKIFITILILISFGCNESKSNKGKSDTEVYSNYSKDFDSTKVSAYKIEQSENDSFKPMVKKLSEYEIDELKDLPDYRRLTLSIVIPFDISKESLENTMKSIVNRKQRNDKDIDEIMIFAYDDKLDIGRGYTFGKLLWAPEGEMGNATPEIANSNNRSNYKFQIDIKEKVGNIKKSDLPTQRELEIYNEIMSDKYIDMQEEEYNPIIMKKFNIKTKKELDAIWLKVAGHRM